MTLGWAEGVQMKAWNAEEAEEPASILTDLSDSFALHTDGKSRFFFTYLDRQVQELVIYKQGWAMHAERNVL